MFPYPIIEQHKYFYSVPCIPNVRCQSKKNKSKREKWINPKYLYKPTPIPPSPPVDGWRFIEEFLKSQLDIENYFGKSISFNDDGTILAVGEPYGNNDYGSVYIYRRNSPFTEAEIITQNTYITSSFGWSVKLNGAGDRIIIGGHTSGDGVVWIYDYDGTSWVLNTTLEGNIGTHENFGYSVTMNYIGNIVAIGAPGFAISNQNVYIYENTSGTSWSLISNFTKSGNVYFGYSLDINDDGTVLAVGEIIRLNFSGKIYIYKYQSGSWNPVPQEIYPNLNKNGVGVTVALNGQGNIVTFGGFLNQNVDSSGSVWLYTDDGSTWNQTFQINSPPMDPSDKQMIGFSVDIDRNGNTLVMSTAAGDLTSEPLEVINFLGIKIYDISGSNYTLNKYFKKALDPSQIYTTVAINGPGDYAVLSGQIPFEEPYYLGVMDIYTKDPLY